MKNFLLSILLFTFTFSFSQKNVNFKVFGKVNGLNNAYIYLSYDGVGENRKWDSVKIRNNKFYFEGYINESKNGFLTTLKTKRVNDLSVPNITDRIFIDPNSEIKIEFNAKNFHLAKIQGSKSQIDFANFQNSTKQNNNNYEKVAKDYISKNFNTYVGMYLLKDYYREFSYAQIKNFYKNLSFDNANSEYGKSIKQIIEKFELAIPGKEAYNFSGKSFDGQNIELKNFQGNYVLVDFWASWCKPCREKNPELVKLFNKYKDKGFIIIGVTDDIGTEKQWEKAIIKDKIEIWPQIIDNKISNQYAVSFLPTQFLIDKTGKIIHRYDDVNEKFENLKTDLEEIFKK